MSVKLSSAGTQASIKDSDGRGGLCIALSQPRNSTARWKFNVMAHTDEAMMPIGQFISCPPGILLSRIIAIANCPGAKNWSIDINLISGTADNGEVSLAVGWPSGTPGLSRIGERYKQYQGSAAGVVSILAGEVVTGWTASAGAGGGTVIIDTFGAITIPPGGSVSGSGAGLIEGPETFTFIGADVNGYLIEVAESA